MPWEFDLFFPYQKKLKYRAKLDDVHFRLDLHWGNKTNERKELTDKFCIMYALRQMLVFSITKVAATHVIFYLRWECNLKKLLHCHRTYKFVCVAEILKT